MKLTRRLFTAAILAAATFAGAPAFAQDLKELKIGFQKTGLPVIARQQQLIEKALEPKGVSVTWVEFTAGPPLVEALNVGAINVGWTGDAPPIFGQSAGSAIVYVAALPGNGEGEAIVAKADSGIKSVADLKGKKVAVGKGTSAHNLLIAALEKNGLAFDGHRRRSICAPADAAAAFASDKVDAWSIWDPFLAIAETTLHSRRCWCARREVLDVNTYFLANRDFAKAHPEVVTDDDRGAGESPPTGPTRTATRWPRRCTR